MILLAAPTAFSVRARKVGTGLPAFPRIESIAERHRSCHHLDSLQILLTNCAV
jgi:hypothetical protein